MPVRKHKPTTPGRRFATWADNREVTRPRLLRPPDLVSPSVSDFSGSPLVTASCWR